MKKNNLNIVKIDKNKSLFNYEKKILIKELILDLKLGYYEFEKEKAQKVKFSLEIVMLLFCKLCNQFYNLTIIHNRFNIFVICRFFIFIINF